MKKWLIYLREFYANKLYMLLLGFTALCSYGFMVTHYTVGIDDTPYAYYFEEGLAAIVGRWVLFLLNKLVNIADFAPFVTDFAAVLLLMAAVTVWCALFYAVLGDTVPKIGYAMSACLFLSCPLLSEVFTYYLHNGVALGYLFCGISLCFFREGLEQPKQRKESGRRRRQFLFFGLSAVFLWLALGCYESFMTVWLLGICLLLLTERFAGIRRKIFPSLGAGTLTAIASIVLRSLMIAAVTGMFGLGYLKEEAVQRSLSEMASWILQPGAWNEFTMVLKRIFVMYGVFAYAYYPIKIFVLASLVICAFSIYNWIRKKDSWILLLCVGSFFASFLLVVVEGKATLYRSAQFVPVICGYGALLFVYSFRKFWTDFSHRLTEIVKYAVTAVLCIILWNQCTDLNKWFYVDYMKYEDAKNTVNQVAYELENSFDISKPVVFTGTYDIPRSLIEDAYVEYNSETFYKMQRITSVVDEHLLEKFYRDYGVWVAQTPALSVVEWGRYAFDSDEELVRFAAMHGHQLVPLLNTEYAPAEELSKNWPRFPQEGAIRDVGEYIIVHF